MIVWAIFAYKNKNMSTFKSWTREKLYERFGLKRVYDSPILWEWLNTETPIEDRIKVNLMEMRQRMIRYVDYWNEEEVKLKFIGNIISSIDYDTDEISAFSERAISGIVDGEELNGEPDLIVARGKQEVKTPFFFLHEYKKELDNNSPDPAGQCLAAMLLAYEQNLNTPKMAQKPIMGAYIVGRNWFFMTLQGREYCISDAYVSTHEDDLLSIYRIMKASKERIEVIWNN
jgi:hypothetical protein